MKLSESFVLAEFTVSATAAVHGYDNTPNDKQIDCLRKLCTNVLQPLRNHFGLISISSGFRCRVLNNAVGGASTSQHLDGKAADIKCANATRLELATWIRDNLDFDQCILEPSWVHVSYNEGRNRKECLTAKRNSAGKMEYTGGFNDSKNAS